MNRIRVLRAEKGLSQAALAAVTAVSRQAINMIENGRHAPSISLAYRISDALGAPVTEVFIHETA